MDRSVVILLLAFCSFARADYVCTNFDGVVISVANRTDPALNYAAGHITTNAAPYIADVQIDPVQSPPLEVPYIVLQDVADATAWGIYIDDGDIIGGVLDHASPRDPAAIKLRLQAERQARRDLRQDVRTVRTNMVALSTTTNTAAAQAQQIEQLRKAVRDLSAAILKMTKDTAP